MSNLLKSKFLLGVLVVAVLVVGGVAFSATPAAADCSIVSTLRAGSVGTEVQCLQTIIGATADGKFGPMTKAAVMAWQAGHGLSADGVVGPMTRAALMGAPMAGNYPAGCTSTVGFSSTTGVKCDSGVSSGLPAGCMSTVGYSSTTGAKCDGGSTPSTGGLSGGAGTLDFSTSTSNTENTVKEGATEKVLAFKAEADGSDIEVTNIKVILKNDDFAATSEKLTDYVDEVLVWMGDKEVGSADASDFSRDSGSPDTYTKTITLSNAIVREDVKATFFVGVSANSSIDTTDMATADWNIEADTVRYTDATGIVLSESLGDNANFDFEDGSADDDMSIKSSSANPLASTLQVEENKSSDEFLVGAFKLDVDEDSDDVSVLEIPVYLEIGVNTIDNGAYSSIESIVDQVRVKVNGDWYDGDLVDDSTVNTDFDGATGTATYVVEFDEGELTIDSGDQAEVKIYVTFNDQDTIYDVGTTVVASVVGSAIDAETGNDDVTVTGSFTGKTHTVSVNAPMFSLVSKSLALYQAIDGVAAGMEDVFLAKFVFNVEAADDDVYLSKGIEGDEATYGTVDNAGDTLKYTRIGAGAIDSYLIEAEDESLDDGLTSSFLIPAGSIEKFTVSFFVRGNNESEKFTIDSFAYGTADDAVGVFDYDLVVDSGLTAFTTNTVYLAK